MAKRTITEIKESPAKTTRKRKVVPDEYREFSNELKALFPIIDSNDFRKRFAKADSFFHAYEENRSEESEIAFLEALWSLYEFYKVSYWKVLHGITPNMKKKGIRLNLLDLVRIGQRFKTIRGILEAPLGSLIDYDMIRIHQHLYILVEGELRMNSGSDVYYVSSDKKKKS